MFVTILLNLYVLDNIDIMFKLTVILFNFILIILSNLVVNENHILDIKNNQK